MAEIINFDGVTKLDIPAERVTKAAAEADLEHAVVIGWKNDGEFYFASSYGDLAHTLWLLEQAKRSLFEMSDNPE